jgi:hypothetical protein
MENGWNYWEGVSRSEKMRWLGKLHTWNSWDGTTGTERTGSIFTVCYGGLGCCDADDEPCLRHLHRRAKLSDIIDLGILLLPVIISVFFLLR